MFDVTNSYYLIAESFGSTALFILTWHTIVEILEKGYINGHSKVNTDCCSGNHRQLMGATIMLLNISFTQLKHLKNNNNNIGPNIVENSKYQIRI